MGNHASPEPICELSGSALSTNRPASSHNPRRGHVASLRQLRVGLLARIRAVRPEAWWLLLFASLLVAFGLALVVQPTVGRGGR
jgi:hypothetical protein